MYAMPKEEEDALRRRLVISRNRQGKCKYDGAAKAQLIEACLRPGVSIARMALIFGVNANMLRTWISDELRTRKQGFEPRQDHEPLSSSVVCQEKSAGIDAMAAAVFVPVVTPVPQPVSTMVSAPIVSTAALVLNVRLPNGVGLELGQAGVEEAAPWIQMLGRLPCFGSMKD